MAALHPDWTVDSAGTSDWHIGSPPYGPMQQAARARGLDLSGQRARQVTSRDFGTFDRVIAMDASVLADLHAMPDGARAELFGAACGLGDIDVPDPYYTRDFDGCLTMIEAGVNRL